ncbi:hypothetical protein I4U23_016115 [Adineta vaga]|nr:hypothetical protein I4U23_016115 [Adineta vaga]
MIGTTKVYQPPDIQRTRRIKKISTILGTTLFILSLAFPAYIVKTIVTKQPTYTIIKPKVTKSVTQTIRIAQPSLALYPQTSIKDMLSNLMIEQLLTTLFYSRYYEQCAPSFCTYLTQTTETVESIDLFENKTDIISMIGLVIGIIGGIIAILHSILLSLVKLIIDRN